MAITPLSPEVTEHVIHAHSCKPPRWAVLICPCVSSAALCCPVCGELMVLRVLAETGAVDSTMCPCAREAHSAETSEWWGTRSEGRVYYFLPEQLDEVMAQDAKRFYG